MENIIITGGAGFLGSNIANRMAKSGYDVYATYHSKKPVYPIDGVSYVRADLLDLRECDRIMKGKDILVMCAAYVSGIAGMQKNPFALMNDSTRINLNTLEAAYKNGIKKCIFISTGAVYPLLDFPAKEENAFLGDPVEKYFMLGWSKRFAEILCRMYGQKIDRVMDMTVLRIDNVYGPFDTFEGNKAHVIPSLIRKVVKQDNPIVIWGDGEEKKDFLYVEDLTEAVSRVIEKCQGFHEYNVVYGENITINQVLQEIMKINNSAGCRIEHDLTKPSSVSERNLDGGKILEELGFYAKTGIQEGLEKTIQWYKKYSI